MATDQEIRDAGFKYIPQQKYLQNPFVLPEDQEPVVDEGIVNTNAFANSGGGDNFSVYNPDPNSIVNRTYQPNYEYRQFVDGYDPNLSATMNMKMMEVDPNYKGADYYNKPPSKMQGLMSMIPYAGGIMKGVKFLGDQISPYLPVNRRSILENELSGKGIMVNDIGQIVQGQGDYDTAENIMAGYNANKITQKTIDKRQGTIEKTLADKYKMSPTDIAAVKAGTYTGPVKTDLIDRYSALDEFGNTLDSTNTTVDKIYDFEEDEKEKKKKDTILGRFLTKKKEAKAAKDAKDAKDAADAKATTYYTPDGTPGGGAGQGIDISGAGTIRSSNNNFQGDSGPSNQQESDSGYGSDAGFSSSPSSSSGSYSSSRGSNFGGRFHGADGGRAGYFFGGRVNFKNGGLASIL